MSIIDNESIKIVVALRMARAALGLSQFELAEMLGISKITLARVETMETPLKAEVYLRAIKLLREKGVRIDAFTSEALDILVEPTALIHSLERLQDDSRRRADRKKGL